MLSYGTSVVKDQDDKSRMGANIGRSLYKEKKGITSQSYIWYDTPHEPNRPRPHHHVVVPSVHITSLFINVLMLILIISSRRVPSSQPQTAECLPP
jgi:hypothetical protein